MKNISRWGISAALFGLAGLAMTAQSCSSSSSSNGAGGSPSVGGSSATGGSGTSSSSTGVGGSGVGGSGTSSSGTGGASSAGGSTGVGGGTAVTGCNASNTDTARSDGLIADFVGTGADAGIEVVGGTTTYGGTGAPSVAITGGALNITDNAAATTAAQYVGAVLFFNNCVDASAYTGVQFTISGSITGCTMQYSTNYSGADDASTDPKGSCMLGNGKCYSPQKEITTSITSTDTQIQVPWATTGGAPVGPVDPKTLTGIQWQLTIGTTGTCAANVTIKNVMFYH